MMNFHSLSSSSYNDLRFSILRTYESLELKAYQIEGIPHHGLGFNLQVSEFLDLVLDELGFDVDSSLSLTASERVAEDNYISQIRSIANSTYFDTPVLRSDLDDVMVARASDSAYTSNLIVRHSNFDFLSDTEVRTVEMDPIDWTV
ncbi:MAG: hypothetical protein GY820_42755 [Gammaproteobacteria bacterium]|nr:hypothetical protein [Gammaproteobacteria bacterium]